MPVVRRVKEGVLLLVIGLVVIPLLPPIFVGVAAARLWERVERHRLRRRFDARWGAEGRQMVFVYSDSPHWKDRIEREVLPRIEDRAVVLNWSERGTDEWRRRTPEIHIMRSWGAERDFNPLAVVLVPGRPVQVIRFRQAYRDLKHGKPGMLKQRERELFDALEVPHENRLEVRVAAAT